MEQKFKSGFVSLIGKTNSGKSTLLNNLANEKIAITTPKTQTTRTAIKAIINSENSQIIIIDTPGIHKEKSVLSKTMIHTAINSVLDADVILFLIEATEKDISEENFSVIEKIKNSKKPCILLINKVDLVKKDRVFSIIEKYKVQYDFKSIIPISALNGKNTDIVIKEIEKLLPVGPKYYEDDEYTDQTVRELAAEIIREKALKLLNDEVPHGIFVEIEKFSLRETSKGKEIYDVEATIYCLRESHKGIIIGKNGEKLKQISTYARQDIEKITGTKVNLRVWVKVKNDWINNSNFVHNKFEK